MRKKFLLACCQTLTLRQNSATLPGICANSVLSEVEGRKFVGSIYAVNNIHCCNTVQLCPHLRKIRPERSRMGGFCGFILLPLWFQLLPLLHNGATSSPNSQNPSCRSEAETLSERSESKGAPSKGAQQVEVEPLWGREPTGEIPTAVGRSRPPAPAGFLLGLSPPPKTPNFQW